MRHKLLSLRQYFTQRPRHQRPVASWIKGGLRRETTAQTTTPWKSNWHPRRQLTTTRNITTTSTPTDATDTDTHESSSPPSASLYLHVGPSGDVWTGDSIFAAKHLQPDYVRSVSLQQESPPALWHDDDGARLVEVLEDRIDWTQEIYDTGRLPHELRSFMMKEDEEATDETKQSKT